MLSERPIKLQDEIKQHIAMWFYDEKTFKKLPKPVQDSLRILQDSIKTHENIEELVGASEIKKQVIDKNNSERTLFIRMYQSKYLEATDLNCKEQFNGTTFVILNGFIDKLSKEGSTVKEYLTWFYDDFLSRAENKKLMPPTFNLAISNSIYEKFLFQFKDTFKMRKNDVSLLKKKNAILGISLGLYKETNDSMIEDYMVKFNGDKTNYAHIRNYVFEVAKKLNKSDILKAIQECDAI